MFGGSSTARRDPSLLSPQNRSSLTFSRDDKTKKEACASLFSATRIKTNELEWNQIVHVSTRSLNPCIPNPVKIKESMYRVSSLFIYFSFRILIIMINEQSFQPATSRPYRWTIAIYPNNFCFILSGSLRDDINLCLHFRPPKFVDV